MLSPKISIDRSFDDIYENGCEEKPEQRGKYLRLKTTRGGATPNIGRVLKDLLKEYKVGILSVDFEEMMKNLFG